MKEKKVQVELTVTIKTAFVYTNARDKKSIEQQIKSTIRNEIPSYIDISCTDTDGEKYTGSTELVHVKFWGKRL